MLLHSGSMLLHSGSMVLHSGSMVLHSGSMVLTQTHIYMLLNYICAPAAEFGDFVEEKHTKEFLSDYILFPQVPAVLLAIQHPIL